jgi:formylglycine-generating enzyme
MLRRVRRFGATTIPAVLVASFLSAASAHANVFDMPPGLISLETVVVGGSSNAPDTRYVSPGYGAVGYVYRMGKFEVTVGQYTEFLNAVAKTDTYWLYSTYMDTAVDSHGCNIKRSGSSGHYTYSVGSGSQDDIRNWANRPVAYISWGDAARFANWLHNGQPVGAQGLSTTEDGSYYLNGATSNAALFAVTRKADATWVIPSEDEWYKAAYYDAAEPGGAGYWEYPTRSNTMPSNLFDLNGTNNANYYTGIYTIGAPYWRTEAGAFAGSPSAYGTFDQGGNVWEWNEAQADGYARGNRGGSLQSYGGGLRAYTGNASYPMNEGSVQGFRIAYVPEPAALLLVAIGGLAVTRRRRG